ncbi:gluconokinase [Streptomyces aidingensis]|uniref:Gluconokinase n=1 Tax=Streptomyces aidingensis TaxID=910347 RepID=A0A1I1R4G1_9ACTN|nr:gluconokinase [Streptomyces aidingensis]SFD26453.1 gluconokinase [Streptomyces aidingensis]
MKPPTALVVMGVSGSGKSTLASLLAQRLGWELVEADELHPRASVAKMAAGIPLTDADRLPWLALIRDRIGERAAAGLPLVVACSALKRSYRDLLRQATGARVRFVHLAGSRELIDSRMRLRTGHFMPPSLLDSQFRDLEPLGADEDGVTVPLDGSPERMADTALDALALP